jgi:hypothetical protein
MSAGTIPYHLRQNKAVERNLFIDLLSRINRYRNISTYKYISMGGPFLEDFKLLHSQLRMNDFVCIEMDQNVHERQSFNKPFSYLKLVNSSMGDFITNSYFGDSPCVVWLDYANPKQLHDQLNEFSSLLGKLKLYDVVKITLNANIQTLGEKGVGDERWEHRLNNLKSRMGPYFPANTDLLKLRQNYPEILMEGIRLASANALRGRSNEKFFPLASFTYKDSSHQMLTLTGIILPRESSCNTDRNIGSFFKVTRLMKWRYSNLRWQSPRDISLPDLSARERLFLESLLPGKHEMGVGIKLQRNLGFRVEDKMKDSANLLENFNEYYRHLPWYTKATI